MANFGTVMRDEITRLSRRASKRDLASLRKISAQQRRHIAALRRELSELAQQVSVLTRQMPRTLAAPDTRDGTRFRFVPKGLRSHRVRLGLTAGQLASLIKVSNQTVYNWEGGVTRPRPEQVSALAQLRSLTKREAHARLDQLTAKAPKARRTST